MQREHNGGTVELTNTWTFRAVELDREYPSFDEACRAIDNAEKRIHQQAKVRLSLPVLDKGGGKAVITGVHAGHGHLLTDPKSDSYTRFYPDTPMLAEALAKSNALEMDTVQMNALLGAWTIPCRANSGIYDVETIQVLHARLMSEAEGRALADELARFPRKKLRF